MENHNKNQPPKQDYTETINGITFRMIFVEGGEVFMGEGQEKHRVVVPDFHIAETPVTQELWRAVMGKDPVNLAFKGDKRPVERVSWLDIVEGTKETEDKAFLQELNQKPEMGLYKLPSEAMWQYAAQGGNKSEGYRYAGSDNLKEVGWFIKNSQGETNPVGLKLPNELGLYDMSGNVWEWCGDVWNDDLKSIPINGLPNEKVKNDRRVVRGGSWLYYDNVSRFALRDRDSSDYRNVSIGFRLARY